MYVSSLEHIKLAGPLMKQSKDSRTDWLTKITYNNKEMILIIHKYDILTHYQLMVLHEVYSFRAGSGCPPTLQQGVMLVITLCQALLYLFTAVWKVRPPKYFLLLISHGS